MLTMVLPVICSPFERRPLKRRAFLSNPTGFRLGNLSVCCSGSDCSDEFSLSYCSSLLNLLDKGGMSGKAKFLLGITVYVNFCLRKYSQDV